MISMFFERDRAHHGMAAEGDPVRVHRGLGQERLHHPVAGDHGADRGVRGREPLGAGDDVRPDVVALGREPVADPAEAGDHLVGREQDVVAVAELAHPLPVARRGDEGAARVLDRLHVDETDRLRIHLQDRPLELVEQEGRELLLRLLRRPVVAVGVAHVPHLGDERLERRAERLDAVDRQGPKGRAVVGDVAGDRLVLVARRRAADLTRNHLAGLDAFHLLRAPTHREVLPRQLPRRLHRLGAARDEEDPIEVTRRRATQSRPPARSRADARTSNSYRTAVPASAQAPPGRSPPQSRNRG